MRKILPFLLVLLLFLLVLPQPSLAFRHQILNDVLGAATTSALPQIPPTAEGPGLILPDSPLFFLDQWKQDLRVLFAFTPQAKAQVYASIAGERLAELRYMLAKNNVRAANVDLQGISDNLKFASQQVSQAQFAGQDVSKLAQQINDNIKQKQDVLDSLGKSSTGVLSLEVQQTQESLFESKAQVEDSLPEGQIQNEVKLDLARRIADRVESASVSAKLLKSDLNLLTEQASEAAQASLEQRQEALKQAMENKNEKLKQVQEKLLENEKKRQEAILEAQKKAAEEAFSALENAQTAAVGFQKAQQELEQIQTTSNSGSSPSAGLSGSSGGSPGLRSGAGGESPGGGGKD